MFIGSKALLKMLVWEYSKLEEYRELSRDYESKVVCSKRSPAMNLRPRLHRSGEALFVRPILPARRAIFSLESHQFEIQMASL